MKHLLRVTFPHNSLKKFIFVIKISGTSPGLYTEDELQSIVSQMMPGGVQTKRIDKIEQAFERFIKRIKQHLHVIVCLSFRGMFITYYYLHNVNKYICIFV